MLAYHSSGRCLIIGDVEFALEQAAALSTLKCTVVTQVPDQPIQRQETDTAVTVIQVPALQLVGYLGAFEGQIPGEVISAELSKIAGLSNAPFDLVLDLGDQPILTQKTLPPGYFAPRSEPALHDAIEALHDLVGTFERPLYNAYTPMLCAHSRSGQNGCQQCIDVCDAGAIQSDCDGIKVDPYLCHGCGGCASVCPSGALRYAFPDPASGRQQLRAWLTQRESVPHTLVFYHHERDLPLDNLDDNAFAVAVESVPSIGLDTWLDLLAQGVGRVVLLMDDLDSVDALALEKQMRVGRELLAPLGIDPDALLLSAEWAAITALQPFAAWVEQAARFAPQSDKRLSIRLCIEHLMQQRATQPEPQSLPLGSPFGAIAVDGERCTLCMSCTNVCPSGALLAGGDTPTLNFIEEVCVQCGLCRNACPESAITRLPRYVYDAEQAREKRVLHEDKPFACVRCSKVFAPSSMIESMTKKLQNHPMFQDPAALNRLRMCEDCRVIDMMEVNSPV